MKLILLSTLLPFALAWAGLRWMLSSSLSRRIIDAPNQRSLHTAPVPRTGGIAIMGAIMVAWACAMPAWLLPMMLAALSITGLSFWDDAHGLSSGLRLIAHCAVAAGWLMATVNGLPWWGGVLLVIAIVWVTNLFNFMDGSDGLAGGMAMFGFGLYAASAWMHGNIQLALVNAAISAAAAAFLLYNFHPARIFMGDAGSIPLGFLAAAIGIFGWQKLVWPVWLPLLVFSPFLLDATLTLLKRLRNGEKIWQAHRSHYYQRLVRMGFGHRNTALMEYCLMFMAGVSALFLLRQPAHVQALGLILWLLMYCLLALLVDRMWTKCDVD